MTTHYPKKVTLGVRQRRTKWAPFWAVVRRHGPGRKVHPSSMTKQRRHWRRTKLKIKPRRQSKQQLG